MKEWIETPEPGYLVSSDGEVWSKRSNRLLQPYLTKGGYPQVDLGGKIWSLSHLVYKVFRGKKPHRLIYLDGNVQNCAYENLERDSKIARNFELKEDDLDE